MKIAHAENLNCIFNSKSANSLLNIYLPHSPPNRAILSFSVYVCFNTLNATHLQNLYWVRLIDSLRWTKLLAGFSSNRHMH